MTFAAKGPAPGGRADPLELSSLGSVDGSDLKPPRPNGQIKFQAPHQAEAEFDVEITLALGALHWRTAALFLNLTAKYAEAGDYLSLDRNRRLAREQFLEANELYKQFQETRRAAADVIVAEAFLMAPP